jgi:Flavodoxin-like fold
MNNILLINSSIFGAQSRSFALARELLTRFPNASVIQRTLTAESMPHLSAETMAAIATPEAQRTERQKELADFADTLIAEAEAADTIVLAAQEGLRGDRAWRRPQRGTGRILGLPRALLARGAGFHRHRALLASVSERICECGGHSKIGAHKRLQRAGSQPSALYANLF